MLHEGEMRRSEEELGDLMRRGTSAEVWSDMSVEGTLIA